MTCSKKNKRLLHALLDGELDAMNAVETATLAGSYVRAIAHARSRMSAGRRSNSGSITSMPSTGARRPAASIVSIAARCDGVRPRSAPP